MSSTKTVALLDDDPRHLFAMVRLLVRRFDSLAVATFRTAPEMTRWFESHGDDCVLVSLEYGLGPDRRDGTGRDVVTYLAGHSPFCPVVLHGADAQAAAAMENVLVDAGWSCTRVSPYDDLLWIGESWIEAVRTGLNFTE